jgi:hypothetical protein
MMRAVFRFVGIRLLQNLDGRVEAVVGFQDLAAEDLAGDFDLLGEADFFFAGQERDLAHLGEIHSDRVVDALGSGFCQFLGKGFEVDFIIVLFVFALGDDVGIDLGRGLGRGRLEGRDLDLDRRLDLRRLGVGLVRGLGGAFGLELVDVRVVDELDAHLVDRHQQRVELVGRHHLVRQPLIEFLVRQISP